MTAPAHFLRGPEPHTITIERMTDAVMLATMGMGNFGQTTRRLGHTMRGAAKNLNALASPAAQKRRRLRQLQRRARQATRRAAR